MIIVVYIIAAIVIAVIGFIIFRLIVVKKQNSKINKQRFIRVEALYNKLELGENVTEDDVRPYAVNAITRGTVFEMLSEHNKLHLFPNEYLTFIHAAESSLVNWLEFPTELGAIPDEIEHIKRVTIDSDEQNTPVHYEVFKYRVNEPHWAAKNGWMLGVVGPYLNDSKPYDFPGSTFSRVSSTIDKVTPEEEARWVHENIT